METGLRMRADNLRQYSPEILTAKGSRLDSHEMKARATKSSMNRKSFATLRNRLKNLTIDKSMKIEERKKESLFGREVIMMVV